MQFFIGTSGYSYSAWKGRFYPPKLRQTEFLGHYAGHFATVEMNNTFYRMPEADDLKSWARQVPAEFRFALKAPRRITHLRRLKNAEEETREFLRTASVLKSRRGPLLFQLPPNFKRDVPRIQAFLKTITRRTTAAFEFRHASWLDAEVFDLLRKKSCALCIADNDDAPDPEIVGTTNWGYIRLRRANYTDRQLRAWIRKIRSQDWDTVYVFFKHEDTGTGPKFGSRFLKLVGSEAVKS